MDRPAQPHVVRTWVVERIRTQAPAPARERATPDKSKTRRPNRDTSRRKP
jgi:hypothetical protein